LAQLPVKRALFTLFLAYFWGIFALFSRGIPLGDHFFGFFAIFINFYHFLTPHFYQFYDLNFIKFYQFLPVIDLIFLIY